jgi:hypothetical protein
MECTIWLTGMLVAGGVTEERFPPAYRQIKCNVTIDIRREKGGRIDTSTHAFTSDWLSWYIDGKEREVKK